MQRVQRKRVGRAAWAGAAVWALSAAAGAPAADGVTTTTECRFNPIAASNGLTAVPAPPAETVPVLPPPPPVHVYPPQPLSLMPPAPAPRSVTSPAAVPGPAPVTTHVPAPSAPPAGVGAPAMPIHTSLSVPPPPSPLSVTWAAPSRRTAPGSSLPTSDRPMMPCDPVAAAPPAPAPVVAPPAPAPMPPAPATWSAVARDKPLPPPTPVTPPAAKAELPAPTPISSCRFVERPKPEPAKPAPAKPAPAADKVFYAAIRGQWQTASGGSDAEALRQTVEAACRAAEVPEARAEVVGEKQVRVVLTVRNQGQWQQLYDRLRAMQELGDQGVVFQVRVKPAHQE